MSDVADGQGSTDAAELERSDVVYVAAVVASARSPLASLVGIASTVPPDWPERRLTDQTRDLSERMSSEEVKQEIDSVTRGAVKNSAQKHVKSRAKFSSSGGHQYMPDCESHRALFSVALSLSKPLPLN